MSVLVIEALETALARRRPKPGLFQAEAPTRRHRRLDGIKGGPPRQRRRGNFFVTLKKSSFTAAAELMRRQLSIELFHYRAPHDLGTLGVT